MTTAKDLIEFLTQFPDDTTVEVVKGSRSVGWSGDYYSVVDLVIPDKNANESFFEDLVEYQVKWSDRPGTLLLGGDE